MTTNAVRDMSRSVPDSTPPLTWQQIERQKCERKPRFERWDMAKKASRHVKRARTMTGTHVGPFKCRICGGVHNGTRPARKRRIKELMR
jgi:hypothetical protein